MGRTSLVGPMLRGAVRPAMNRSSASHGCFFAPPSAYACYLVPLKVLRDGIRPDGSKFVKKGPAEDQVRSDRSRVVANSVSSLSDKLLHEGLPRAASHGSKPLVYRTFMLRGDSRAATLVAGSGNDVEAGGSS